MSEIDETRSLLLGDDMEDIDLAEKKTDDESNDAVTLRIKCNSPGIDAPKDGSDWFRVMSSLGVDVQTLKQQVRDTIGETARGRYLRLIAKGRLLAPDSALLKDFHLKQEDYIHAVVAPVGVRGGQQAVMAQANNPTSSGPMSRRQMRSVGVGPTGLILARRQDESDSSEEEMDVESANRSNNRRRERRGFDRLRNGTVPGLSSVNLTRDEVAAIRLYFRRSVDQFAERRRRRQQRRAAAVAAAGIADSNTTQETSPIGTAGAETSTPAPSSPVSDEARRRLERFEIEEEWMTAQGSMSEFRMNLRANASTSMILSSRPRMGSNSIFDTGRSRNATNNTLASTTIGNDRDFMWGFFMGFFVGFVMLFWVWMPTVSHKQKIGILTGISCQLGFHMLQQSAIENLEAVDEVANSAATLRGDLANLLSNSTDLP